MNTVFVSVHIESPAARVWEVIGDPASIASWHPAIAESPCEGDRRSCVLANGARVEERIEAVDAAARTYRYSIIGGPLPVSDYHATIEVEEIGPGRSSVAWSSTFEEAGAPATDVSAMVRDVFTSGLEALRARLS